MHISDIPIVNYLLNSYMVDLSWFSAIMCTITFTIFVKYRFSCLFHKSLTIGSLSIDQFDEELMI